MHMVVSLLANIGIIFLYIYLFWKINLQYFNLNTFSKKQTIILTVLQIVTGLSLLYFSVETMGIHYDFRVVLFVVSMNFLGEKITRYTILGISIGRFLYGGLSASFLNLLIAFVLIFTLATIYSWSKKHFTGLGQMLLMSYYNIALTTVGSYILLKDMGQVVINTGVLVLTTSAMITLIYSVMKDVQYLTKLGIHDELTGLYNSRQLQEDLRRLSHSETNFALLVIDIDNFKTINDKYGHLVGDLVLIEMGSVLLKLAKDNYFFYRYGGEEFVTIVENCKDTKAEDIAQDILEKIQETVVDLDGHPQLEFTVSIGVAYRTSKEDLISTFHRADSALYVAKEKGKNQIVYGEN